MPKFKVVTPAGVGYGTAGADYALEMEALGPLGAEIVEVAGKTEDEFIRAARDGDALYAKGRSITKRMIDGLERCKVIALGSVGVDSVDVAAATARGIPVTNVPDTFIEEVADHAMMHVSPDAKCVRECVKAGGNVKYVLFDGKNVYKLSDQATPAQFAAQKVRISGTLFPKTGIIQVERIERAD